MQGVLDMGQLVGWTEASPTDWSYNTMTQPLLLYPSQILNPPFLEPSNSGPQILEQSIQNLISEPTFPNLNFRTYFPNLRKIPGVTGRYRELQGRYRELRGDTGSYEVQKNGDSDFSVLKNDIRILDASQNARFRFQIAPKT